MLERIPSPYSILFANKTICAEFLHEAYKFTPFTFELLDISTASFKQWVVSSNVLSNITTCRFQFDMNDRSLVIHDPHHRELNVPQIARYLPKCKRMDATVILQTGMNDDNEEDKTGRVDGSVVEDVPAPRASARSYLKKKKEKERLVNIFEIPVEELCEARLGEQCYLIF